jgi:AraC family transcriptional regulator
MLYIACVMRPALSSLPTSNDPFVTLAHCPAARACLPVTVVPIPASGEMDDDHRRTQRIFVAQQGQGHRWGQSGGRTRALQTAPRMIEILEAGFSFDHCGWNGQAGRAVMVEFADADVEAVTHGEIPTLRLRTVHELFDDRVSRITLELAEEALNGLPNGRLYMQGLCLALLGMLDAHYTVGRPVRLAGGAGQLGSAEQKRLIDLVHAQLAADLSLTRLADEVGLSTYHFVRVFKATFGTTPHRYVLERRLEAVAEVIRRETRTSIADIALAHGFASQAHMTALFRQRFGVTPGAIRRA